MKRRWAGNKVIFFILTVIVIAGCGLKANPVSKPIQDEKPVILTATIADDAIVLFWQSPEETSGHARIDKSVLGTSGNICKDCPRSYSRIAELTVPGASRYVDEDVEKGKSYDYRISLCDARGDCRQTQTVHVDMK